MTLDALKTVRFVLAALVAIIIGLVAVWDAYADFTGRPEFTVSAAVKDFRNRYPATVVAASLLFYHLFLEK